MIHGSFTLSEKQNGTEEHYVAFLLCISDAHLVCLKRYTSIKISGVVRLTWSPTPADDTSHDIRTEEEEESDDQTPKQIAYVRRYSQNNDCFCFR